MDNPGNITQNSNPNLDASLPPVTAPVTPPVQVATAVAPKEKYAFPDHTDKDLKKKLRKEKTKDLLRYLPLIIVLIIAVGLGYLYYNARNALATQKTATDKATSDYNAQKAIVDAKSNCDVCPAVPVEATPAPATTSTKKSTSVSTQETVVAPPAPPSD